MTAAAAADLTDVHIAGGVNDAGEAFCSVTAVTGDRRLFVGQLDTATVRRMAMDWLECAEAADQDAAVLRVVRRLELPDELAGAVVIELRNSRGDGYEAPPVRPDE